MTDLTSPSRRLPPILGALGLAALVCLGALALGFLTGRWPFAFDRTIILGVRAWGGPHWLRAAAVDITALGSGTVLTLTVIAATGLLGVRRLWLTALATTAAALSGGIVSGAIKGQVARARPDLVPHLVDVSNYSFPSGHATNSAVVYLTLAALASQVAKASATRRYLIAAAALLVGAIGASRVYLGVHWPSDVLAGWSLGTLWAIGWWWLLERARRRIGGER